MKNFKESLIPSKILVMGLAILIGSSLLTLLIATEVRKVRDFHS